MGHHWFRHPFIDPGSIHKQTQILLAGLDIKNVEHRKGDASREEVAHKVAWNGVKKKYEKKKDVIWKSKE